MNVDTLDLNFTNETLNTSPGGYDCRFIKINDQIGLKLYQHEDTRDFCYEQQILAFDNEVGPNTYGKKDLEIEGKIYYGYFTEVAQTVTYHEIRNRKEEKDTLTERLVEIGINKYTINDLSAGNLGLVNDKLVPIDFGRGGFDAGWKM